ncbi:MAG: hypothetical protein AAF593_04435 [Planctomycetota bacterium]
MFTLTPLITGAPAIMCIVAGIDGIDFYRHSPIPGEAAIGVILTTLFSIVMVLSHIFMVAFHFKSTAPKWIKVGHLAIAAAMLPPMLYCIRWSINSGLL